MQKLIIEIKQNIKTLRITEVCKSYDFRVF